MTLKQDLIANQNRIVELASSIELWAQSGGVTREDRSKAKEVHERLLFRLRQLELEGQKAKIDAMEAILALYKHEAKV